MHVALAGLSLGAVTSPSTSRRAVLLGSAAAGLSPAAATAGSASDEVARVLLEPWEDAPTFGKGSFRRLDESDDADFYSTPRLVYHIDDAAVAAANRFYKALFQELAGARAVAPLDVLDLCSSWVSHYPAEDAVRLGRVAGLGMNAEELAANPRLSEWTVRDLNKTPTLPYADGSFDAVTCTVSIDYLTRPLEVVRECSRVLRPGGRLAVLISNRLFFSKAVALWTGKDDLEHVYTVGAYVHYGAGAAMSEPRAIDLSPRARGGKLTGDPLYAIIAEREAQRGVALQA